MKNLPIIFSNHAEDAMRKRGANHDEVEKALRTAEWIEARRGRYEAKLDFPFAAEWNRNRYETKQVNPVFVVEDSTIVVITVYVFYFS